MFFTEKHLINELNKNKDKKAKIVIAIFRFGQNSAVKSNLLGKFNFKLYQLLDLFIIKFIFNCELPYTAKIGKGLILPHPYGIIIHECAIIGENNTILHHCTIGWSKSRKNGSGTPTIGDNVLINSGAKLVGNIQIGSNSVIGANAVVTNSFPNNSILVGVPAFNLVKKGGNDEQLS